MALLLYIRFYIGNWQINSTRHQTTKERIKDLSALFFSFVFVTAIIIRRIQRARTGENRIRLPLGH